MREMPIILKGLSDLLLSRQKTSHIFISLKYSEKLAEAFSAWLVCNITVLDGIEMWGTTFHVVASLNCDCIVGEELE